jgi:hypothetical protein
MAILRKTDRTPRSLSEVRQTRRSSQLNSQQQNTRHDHTPTVRSKLSRQSLQSSVVPQNAQSRATSPSTQALILYNATLALGDGDEDEDQQKENEPPVPTSSSSSSQLLSKQDIDSMTLEHVKDELKRAFHAGEHKRSILDYLGAEIDVSKRMRATASILNELGDVSEEAASYTASIWRYVQLQQPWDPSHKDKTLHSAEAFENSLEQREIFRKNLAYAEKAQDKIAHYSDIITKAWGTHWHDTFEYGGLIQGPDSLSRRVLEQMAAACKAGLTAHVVERWCSMKMLLRVHRPLAKGTNRTQPRRSKHILPADFEGLIDTLCKRKIEGGTTEDVFFPGLREEGHGLLQPDQTAVVTSITTSEQGASRATPVLRSTRKRKLQETKETEETEETDDGKRVLSKSGNWRLVKTRNGHLIREPIRLAAEEASESSSAPQHDSNSQSHSSGLPQITLTQDQSEIPSQYTQRQDTLSISSSQHDDNEPEIRAHDAGCDASLVLDRLTNQLQWSQDTREYCKTCKDAIAAAQYALDRAAMIIRGAHNHSDVDSNSRQK